MTCRIEKGRAKLVIDHHSTGETYLSIRIDGAAFGIMLDKDEAKKAAKALWKIAPIS